MMDSELNDKLSSIGKYESEIKRRMDDIEKKTKEVDLLNRKYERITANAEHTENGENS